MIDSAQLRSEPPRVLLSGRPGCGKTTVIRRAVELIGASRCAGFYTEELREQGRRVGFDVVTVDGQRAPLARAGAAGPRVSRYGVDVGSFEDLGVAALESGLARGDRVLVIDEIGKMELHSDRFVRLLQRILAPGAEWPVLGTILLGRHPGLHWLEGRRDIERISVSPGNRDELPLRLSRIYRDCLGRPRAGDAGTP